MNALARKTAVEYGLIVALLVALVYGLLTPAGGVRADGQGTPGVPFTPGAVGTPLAPAPPAPPAPALPSPSESDAPAPDAPSDAPTPTPPPVAPAATPGTTTAPVATRPRPPATPGGTPGTAPATPQTAATPRGTPSAAPSPSATRVPTATPTRVPLGTVGATIIRDLSPLGFTLNGREQAAATTLDIAVEDTAPAIRQPGWTLTLAVAQFRIAGNAARALPADAVTLLGVRVACADDADCTPPENTVAYPLVLPAGVALPIYSAAAGSGHGAFVVTATFAVRVPATAYAGSYATTLAVATARGGPGLAAQSQVEVAPVATPTTTAPSHPAPTGVPTTPVLATVTPPPVSTPSAPAPTPSAFASPTAPATPAQQAVPATPPTTPPAALSSPAPVASVAPISPPEPVITPAPAPPAEVADPAPDPAPTVAFLATDRIGTTQAVNLRSGPGATTPTQGQLPTGTRLAATGATRTVGGILWRQFMLADGRTGWVRDLDVLPVAR